MISAKDNQTILTDNTAFIASVEALKTLLAANNFPLTVDLDVIRLSLRTQLFEQLLKADKGLKMRWDMLKTDEARLSLITATIDLAGYDVIEEVELSLKAVEKGYNNVYVRGVGFIRQHLTLTAFQEVYSLDLGKWLNSLTYDWSGREHVLSYFQALAPRLQELREMFRAGRATNYALGETCHILSAFYTPASSDGEVEADQGAVMRLARDLEKVGKLALIPKTAK